MEDMIGDRNIDQECIILERCKSGYFSVSELVGRGFALNALSALLNANRITIDTGQIIVTKSGSEYLEILRGWKQL